MTNSTLGARASDSILRLKEELARAVTDTLYSRRPELHDRWGDAGRVKCLQDMRYNLEHLAPAVALDEPALFARYVRWLDELLRARDIPSDDVRFSLELTRDVIASRVPADQAACAAASIDAGIAALAAGAAE